MRIVVAFVAAVLWSHTAPVIAQSTEPDEKPAETKTYTNYELQRAGGARRAAPPSVPANPAPSSAAASGETIADPDAEERGAAEAAWLAEIEEAEAAVARLREQISVQERAMGDTSRDLFGGARRGLAADLARNRELLVEAEARLEELEQEGAGEGYLRPAPNPPTS